MKASEARQLVEMAKAKEAISRFFPLIKKRAELKFTFLETAGLTDAEVDVLIQEGYKVESIYDDSDYHRSRHIGYKIHW